MKWSLHPADGRTVYQPDYQILLQPGTRHSIRISEMRIGMAAQRIGTIEVEMRKATIITDTGNQTRPFFGSIEFERHGLFDTGRHDTPFHRFPTFHGREVESFPTAETGGKHGMFSVGRIYLNIEHPVQRGYFCIGSLRIIILISRLENRFPALATVSCTEHLITFITVLAPRLCVLAIRCFGLRESTDTAA